MSHLVNPSSGQDLWYHGTTLDFEQFQTIGVKRRWTDWNAFLGVHFASWYELAKTFAAPNAGDEVTSTRHSGSRPRVLACRLEGPALHFASEREMNLAAAQWLWNEGRLRREQLVREAVLGPAYGDYLSRYLSGERFEIIDDTFDGLAYSALNDLGRGKARLVRAWQQHLINEGWLSLTYGNTVDTHRVEGLEDVSAVTLRVEDIEIVGEMLEEAKGEVTL